MKNLMQVNATKIWILNFLKYGKIAPIFKFRFKSKDEASFQNNSNILLGHPYSSYAGTVKQIWQRRKNFLT